MNNSGVSRSMMPAALLAACLACSPLWAQASDADRILALERQLNDQKRQLRDYGGLLHYGSDDSELPPPRPGEDRVIFFGDQITEYWGRDEGTFFPGHPWLNRGVAGQTTDQMLIRFRQDVISLHPKVVVILGGLNDIAGLHGPSSEGTAMDNIMSMADIAKANGIKVIFASLTPVCDCFTKGASRQRWQERISGLNELISKYAKQSGAVYLDYYSAMADDDDMKKELTKDGVMPNEAGYNVMAPLAEKSIAESLKQK